MAAFVDVVQGPDRGRRQALVHRELRIGRGAGHEFTLTDAAWGPGCLWVEEVSGGHVVRNQMPHAVYLDGKTLPEGATRTWYAGVKLQPTRNTVLVLTVTAEAKPKATEKAPSPAGRAAPPAPAETVVPTEKSTKPKTGQYILLVGIMAMAGYLALTSGEAKGNTSAGTAHTRAIQALEGVPTSHAHADTAKRIKKTINKAAFRESGTDPASARELYLQARDQIAKARKDGAPESALAPAEEFVLDRLQGLNTIK